MAEQQPKKTLSNTFNHIGTYSMECSSSPAFLGIMFFIGVCASPFSTAIASMALASPATMFGTGFIFKKSGDGIEAVKNKFNLK